MNEKFKIICILFKIICVKISFHSFYYYALCTWRILEPPSPTHSLVLTHHHHHHLLLLLHHHHPSQPITRKSINTKFPQNPIPLYSLTFSITLISTTTTTAAVTGPKPIPTFSLSSFKSKFRKTNNTHQHHHQENPTSPWTHQESINLIKAYQEKWYSLKKGQLKARQWEEVAITVAARCDYDEPSESATQCRHKIEKLRKRYRAERLKPGPNCWQYFDSMDHMERGPLPISAARPMPSVQFNPNNQPNSSRDSDVDYNYTPNSNKSKSINHIVRGGNSLDNVERSGRVLRVSRSPIVRERKDFSEGDEEEGGKWLAVEIRSFSERFVKMENKKIEMMRDREWYRMEMENKRMEVKAFSSSHKKMKRLNNCS